MQPSPKPKDLGEDLAGKLGALTTKKDHEGRRPSNLIIPEGEEFDEELHDIEFHEPTQLALQKDKEPENVWENTTVAVSVWDASAVTSIQINEVELEGSVSNARVAFSDDGQHLLFPYRNKENANVLAVIGFEGLKVEHTIEFDSTGVDMERVHLRMPHPDLIDVAFRSSYDDSFEHFLIQRQGSEWRSTEFQSMEECMPANFLFLPHHPDRAYTIVEDEDADES